MFRRTVGIGISVVAIALLTACGARASESSPVQAFVGARLIDGTGGTPIENSVVVVDGGVIQAVGPAGSVEIPPGSQRIDLSGRTLIPGLVNAHGHVGNVRELTDRQYSRENVLDQLALYARYGITTVVSLGDDREEGVQIRDEQDSSELDRARLYVAGPVISARTPEAGVAAVQNLVAMGVDWAKIRIDDNLGATPKMAPEVYQAIIDEAHRNDLPLAAHIVDLEDAKAALRAGADFIGHSIRDEAVDQELIALLREQRVCVSPTLTRELSTFVYDSRPDFLDDPFFRAGVSQNVLDQLESEEGRRTLQSRTGEHWRNQLPLAMENLKTLSDAGVRIAMGTDSGPRGRFQGYFEHVELDMMVEAGMTPMQVIVAATRDAASCTGLEDVGTIEPGKRADFVVLRANPIEDIRNTRTIESVWINGNRVPGSGDF